MGPFLPLFQVTLEHDFYGQGPWPGSRLVPTRDTQAMIAKAGLLTRSAPACIQVYFDRSRLASLELLLTDADSGLALRFKAYADSEFRNYSESFMSRAGVIASLDSRRGNAHGNRIRLHGGEHVSAQDTVSIDTGCVAQALGTREPAASIVCAVAIRIGSPPSIDPGSDGDITAPHYFARFGARETYWVYYLLGPLLERRASIVDLDGQVDFEALGRTPLGDGRQAFVFRSTVAIPLRQISSRRFQLREAGGGNGRILVRRLPVAAAAQIGKQRLGREEITVSEVYVNG